MSKIFEYHNSGDDAVSTGVYSDHWRAQTFTVGTVGLNDIHNVVSIGLKALRVGLPGDMTVSIRTVDGTGKPSGTDLCSGTKNCDSITTNNAGEWVYVPLTSGSRLAKDTKYAIVVRMLSGTPFSYLRLRRRNIATGYTGGESLSSADAGVTWAFDGKDYMFEEYGEIDNKSYLLISSENNYSFKTTYEQNYDIKTTKENNYDLKIDNSQNYVIRPLVVC